jgi:hypothetical protein
LAYIVASIEQFITKQPIDGVPQDVDTELVMLFSHDANILYLQRLIDLNWIPESFPENVAVPGGLLAFDLWKDEDASGSGSYFVSVSC